MAVDDHSNIEAPVHVCHKCGWPFPNSHPSASHRSAHEKLCGTLEGYKLVVSKDSDDGNHSDEDHKTPCPKLLETSVNEKGSGGTGDRSNRSEDEVFTDAATEFSDISGFSPGVEECLVDAKKLVTNTERVANHDSTSNQSVDDTAIVDIIQSPSSSADSYQMKNHEVPDYKTDQLEITLQYEDDMPTLQSMLNSVTGSTAEELVTLLSNDSSSPLCNSDPNKYDKPVYDTLHESETKAGESVTESSSNVHEQYDYSRGYPEPSVVFGDIVIEHIVTEITEVIPKLEKTEGQDALSADTGPVKLSDDSFDSAQATDSTSSNYMGEVGDGKEGNESVHVLSVPEDVYVVDNPEIKLEGFKGHKGLKLYQPVSSDSCKRIEDKEANLESPICKENSSGFQSKQLIDNSQSEVGVPAYAATVEMKNSPIDSYSKEEIPCDTFRDSLQKSCPDVVTEIAPDENFMETSMDAKVNEITNLVYMAEAGNYEKGRHERLDMAGNENFGAVSEGDGTENTVKTHESPDNMSNFLVSPSKGYSVGHEEHCKSEKYENRGSGRHLEENVPEFACNLQDSPVAAVGVREESNDKVSKIGCSQMDTVSDSSRGGTDVSNIQESKGDKIHGSNTMQAEYVDRVSMPSESYHGKEFETFQKASEYHIGEEGVVLTQISAAIEENDLRGNGGDTSRIGSDTLQAERDNNIATDYSAAADVSIDSCSQTDSVEAHWGSVSVSSAQSETTDLRKLKVEPHRQCSDKSDICELPVFSTLAEPGAVTVQKDDSSDIQAQQNARHSISASAQAGRFPSLTDVVNDSPGRKNNEKMVGVVTEWSSTTSLTNETKIKSPRQKENSIPVVAQKDDKEGTTVNFPSLTDVVNDSPGRKKNEEMVGVVTEWSSMTSLTNKTKIKSPRQKENSIPVVAQKDDKEGTTVNFPSLTNVMNDSPGRKKNEEIVGVVTEWSSMISFINETRRKYQREKDSRILVAQKNDEEATMVNFPSLTNVVNDSPGRKKNEEMIDVATDWSSMTSQSPRPKESPIPVVAHNDDEASTVNSILGTESPADQATTESGKELNSTAKYPSDIKREKRKGGPIWAPFICCFSVNPDEKDT